jgi:hypothetical protein
MSEEYLQDLVDDSEQAHFDRDLAVVNSDVTRHLTTQRASMLIKFQDCVFRVCKM